MSGSLTLLELNRLIKSTIENKFDSPLWVVAEINSITNHRSGHCYVELIQKSNERDIIIAQTRAVIWSNQYRFISSYFESITNVKLTKGIKILVKVSVDFHELYGLSLNIRDIDPSYTLGDLERRKKEIIERLVSEGVMDMNKSLELPLVIQNIAVISSPSAAGFEDFLNHLSCNKYGYKYNISLFEADMQGSNTENSVVQALSSIFEDHYQYDIVAIIRGGGSKSDLSFFDNYNIAFYITQFPLPVFSGIGHERDDCVTDMVSHTKLKTPTAVADYIIEHTSRFDSYISDMYDSIIDSTKNLLKTNELYLTNLGMEIYRTKEIITKSIDKCNKIFYRLKNASLNNLRKPALEIENKKQSLINITAKLLYGSEQILGDKHLSLKRITCDYIQKQNNRLDKIEQNIRLVDPVNVLKRGYSISRINGKRITVPDDINDGDIMETILLNNKITSKVLKNENKE